VNGAVAEAAGPRIVVLDYGMGNLRSAVKALEHVGARAEVTSDPGVVREADGLVLPGVGAFPKAMEEVRRRGIDAMVAERVGEGVPVLGICLGMQLLFDRSTELGGALGLGILAGDVELLDATGLKLPHIGWNWVDWGRASALNEGLPDRCAFYHVHSYAPRPLDAQQVLGTTSYGVRVVSVVERDRVYGVQFHPEKSGPDGLALLRNFAAVCTPAHAT